MEKGQPFRKALTWRPSRSGVEGLRSNPASRRRKLGTRTREVSPNPQAKGFRTPASLG